MHCKDCISLSSIVILYCDTYISVSCLAIMVDNIKQKLFSLKSKIQIPLCIVLYNAVCYHCNSNMYTILQIYAFHLIMLLLAYKKSLKLFLIEVNYIVPSHSRMLC